MTAGTTDSERDHCAYSCVGKGELPTVVFDLLPDGPEGAICDDPKRPTSSPVRLTTSDCYYQKMLSRVMLVL